MALKTLTLVPIRPEPARTTRMHTTIRTKPLPPLPPRARPPLRRALTDITDTSRTLEYPSAHPSSYTIPLPRILTSIPDSHLSWGSTHSKIVASGSTSFVQQDSSSAADWGSLCSMWIKDEARSYRLGHFGNRSEKDVSVGVSVQEERQNDDDEASLRESVSKAGVKMI